jgi:hypothetical protein
MSKIGSVRPLPTHSKSTQRTQSTSTTAPPPSLRPRANSAPPSPEKRVQLPPVQKWPTINTDDETDNDHDEDNDDNPPPRQRLPPLWKRTSKTIDTDDNSNNDTNGQRQHGAGEDDEEEEDDKDDGGAPEDPLERYERMQNEIQAERMVRVR